MADLAGQNIGRYHIIERLGEGGMATVYKAFDTRLERTVAIKFIRKEEVGQSRLAQMLKRFEREGRALAQLTHPNIVSVIDYGEYEGSPYLVMEYIQSGTLKARTGTPMPYQEAARLLAPIADALRYAHQHNTIHRDVKPANILIDESGHPMLSDFGIAKILGVDETTSLTGTNVGIGTPEYMAPEQWNNKVVPQTDMYSLGVVFYELVTGRKPYTADTPAAIAIKQATEPLKRPREFVANLPNEVEAVIFKALARDPSERYADMAAFATALEKLSRGAAIGSAPQKEPTPEKRAYPPSALPAVDKDTTSETPAEKISDHATSNPWRWIALGLGGLVILAVVGWAMFLNKPKPSEPSPEIAQMQTSVAELQAGKTQVVAADASPVAQVTAQETKDLPQAGDINNDIEIVNVPYSEFLMGAAENDKEANSDEKPQHKVSLLTFQIDKTEVTNAMYRKCVKTGRCTYPRDLTYYSNIAQYDNHPVINVEWDQAQVYCNWAGGRLPTEAEWEKAARGTDGRIYPWGNASPNADLLNYNSNKESTKVVGSYPSGNSPYGALNMAGNVWEWVSDWYDKDYYAKSPNQIPTGPISGNEHILRGGSWDSKSDKIRSTARLSVGSKSWLYSWGFRCVYLSRVVNQTPSPEPKARTTRISEKDEMVMVYVPAGEFLMGSSISNKDAQEDEKPQHKVYLDEYWIDKTEVINTMFAKYVKATGYTTDAEKEGWGYAYNPQKDGWDKTDGADWQHPRGSDSSILGKENHPVVQITWKDANGYCEWVGGHLPTEAQWEKAARGTDGQKYPWGNADPSSKLLNFDKNIKDTTIVGSYPNGASPYGALDMAGNVWEWVKDWYDKNYYNSSPERNPIGANNGQARVERGGAWDNELLNVRTEIRYGNEPGNRGDSSGFRCVR